MDRKNLIDCLVSRKLVSESKNRAFCICLARNLCFAQTRQTTGQAPAKK